MAILQVRDIDERLYSSLKDLAKRENRSITQEVIFILEKYLANPNRFHSNSTRDFLSLSWEDAESANTIIKNIRSSRENSNRFKTTNVLFD